MKAVFLDSGTMPVSLEDMGGPIEWIFKPGTMPADVVSALRDAEVAITNKVKITAAILEQLPDLRYICVAASGYDCVDIEACRARGVRVSNAPAYSALSVAEHVIASIFALRRRFFEYRRLAETEWRKSDHFCVHGGTIRDIRGAVLGIVGRGAIGQQVSELALALGMNVMFAEHKGARHLRSGYTPFEDVLCQADILTLHCPLSSSTRNVIDSEALALMKPSAFLVNTARGALVDEAALANALEKGLIAGASLDVMNQEPPSDDSPLMKLDHPNLIITPHVAWASMSSVLTLASIIKANVEGFYHDKLINVIC